MRLFIQSDKISENFSSLSQKSLCHRYSWAYYTCTFLILINLDQCKVALVLSILISYIELQIHLESASSYWHHMNVSKKSVQFVAQVSACIMCYVLTSYDWSLTHNCRHFFESLRKSFCPGGTSVNTLISSLKCKHL